MLWTALGAAAACEPAAAAAATRTTPMAPRARAWTSGKAAAECEERVSVGSPPDRLWKLKLRSCNAADSIGGCCSNVQAMVAAISKMLARGS